MAPSPPRRSLAQRAALLLANLLLPAAILLFASGFFPYKPVLPGLATFAEQQGDDADGLGGTQQPPAPPFDRVVFMVVDALRSDFVFGEGSGMGFTQSLIRTHAALPFTAHASPPTVTMPRVKALTTGSVPSFLDLLLNFAESDTSSSLAGQDTWLAQLRRRPSGTLAFFGDDTWLKLFPSWAGEGESGGDSSGAAVSEGDPPPPFFERADGTSSFFVSDFTEVDHNVTRHLPAELAQRDWSALILHYLGLDHIGHKTGPRGPQMLPKQREMDARVEEIFTAMETQPHLARTLLVLAGDHGMNGAGNHGGSGPGETEPALVFVSPVLRKYLTPAVAAGEGEESEGKTVTLQYECPTLPRPGTEFHFYTKIQQSDLVPTLAALLGFPVPRNSLGVLIPEFLESGIWSPREAVQLAGQNARQVARIVQAMYGEEVFASAVAGYAAKKLTRTKRGKDECEGKAEGLPRLACFYARGVKTNEGDDDSEAALTAVYDFLYEAQDSLSGVASSYNIPRMLGGIGLALLSLLTGLYSVFPNFRISITPLSRASIAAGAFLTAICLLDAVMMFASSYVEEEQHLWYWLTPAWILVLAIITTTTTSSHRRTNSSNQHLPFAAATAAAVFALFATHRLATRWNQTGQKHAGAPDIAHTYFPRAPPAALWSLILLAYGTNAVQIARRGFAGLVAPELAAVFAAVLVAPAIVFKVNFTQADAPELVRGLAEGVRGWTAGWSLVAQARMVFGALAIAVVAVVVLAVWSARVAGSSKSAAVAAMGRRRFPSLAERLHAFLTLFLMTQSRAANVPLFLALEVQFHALRYLLTVHGAAGAPVPPAGEKSTPPPAAAAAPSKTRLTAISTLLLSHVYFFAMGGSNSISSIDLSNAYNGVADYNIVAVGVLLFASNWTAPIWWCSAAVLLLTTEHEPWSIPSIRSSSSTTSNSASQRPWIAAERAQLHTETLAAVMGADKQTQQRGTVDPTIAWAEYVGYVTLFVATSLLGVMAACTVLRAHLFIWTVFSPKYLYAMAWSIGWHVVGNLGVAGVGLVRAARVV